MSEQQTEFTTKKPFAIVVCEAGDHFGIVCSRKGAIDCRQTVEEFVQEYEEIKRDYSTRSYESAMSMAVNSMSFERTAIAVESEEHVAKLMPKDEPVKLVGLSNVSGSVYILTCKKEMFAELMEKGSTL